MLSRRGFDGLAVFVEHVAHYRSLITATALGTAAAVHDAVAAHLADRERRGEIGRVRDHALITVGRAHAQINSGLLAALHTQRLAATAHPAASLWGRSTKALGVDLAREATDKLSVLIGAAGFTAGHHLQKARRDLDALRYADGMHDWPGDPVLDCALDGPATPPLDQLLPIAWRAGIDLNPLDVTDPDDRRWLRALVWPDHRPRAARLDTALQAACASSDRPVVHAGDAAAELPRLAAAAPPSTHLIIYHSAVAAHMPAAARQALTETVLSCSTHRPISWVQAEPRTDHDPRRLRLTECHDGRVIAELALGSYQPHGQWLRWEDAPDPAMGPAIDGAATAGQPG